MTTKKYLFCDIGNSYTDFVLTDFSKTIRTRAKTGSILDKELDHLLENENKENIDAYISSVNKKGLKNLSVSLSKRQIFSKQLTHAKMKTFVNKYKYEISNINILGQDLFCDLIATKNDIFRIIVDIGTATKILVVNKKNIFLGASILPGPYSLLKAIYADTDIKGKGIVQSHPNLLSLDTEECLSSGAIFGTTGAIVSIIELINRNYNSEQSTIYLTGGGSELIKSHLKALNFNDFIYDKNLTIKGLARAFEFDDYEKIS